MKQILILLLIFVTFSCSVSTEPEFKKIQNIYPKTVSATLIEIDSEAVFYNPNNIGCIVKNVDIEVFVNGIAAGNARQKQDISINSKGEFIVPLVAKFTPLQLLNSKIDILNGGINKLLNNEAEIQYKGNVTLEKLGLSYTFDIDKTEKLDLAKKENNAL